MTSNLIPVIIGPTASGKTALAVERALALGNACIINADAMQCYSALPILSAQPTAAEQQNIPHHLFGFLDATQNLNALDWAKLALSHITHALNNNQTPMLVGGTGFYIKALTHGISPIPDIAPHIRATLMAELNDIGLAPLYARLQSQDPAIAKRLKPNDTQRIVRALEVFAGTNTPLSHWQTLPPVRLHDDLEFHITALNPPKEILAKKITARLHVMLNSGLMDEVARLSQRIDNGEVPENANVTIAHGFKYFRAVLKNEMSLNDALEQTALETRQYTKRQRTWLRGQITPDEIIT